MAHLAHPGIVRVIDVGSDEAGPWFLMPYYPMGSLSDQAKTASSADVARWIVQCLHGLHHAHSSGVVHRDIKPENVLVDTAGQASLTDFGVALVADAVSRDTRTDVMLGSFAFMSPEQRLDARGVGPPADIYSMGATAYAAFALTTPIDLFLADVHSPRWTAVPEAVRSILITACQAEAHRRFPNAAAFASALTTVLSDLEALPPVLSPTLGRGQRWSSRTQASPTGTTEGLGESLATVVMRASHHGSQVLLAESDPAVRSLLTRWLVDAGHHVAHIEHPAPWAPEGPSVKAPDLLVLDGHSFDERLEAWFATFRASFPTVPVLATTMSENPDVMVSMAKAGVDRLIFKPLERRQFLERARTLIEDGPFVRRGAAAET